MNQIEAHKLSLEMWTWLVDNPDKGKEEWTKFGSIKNLLAHCYLCEYYKIWNDRGITFNCMSCCLNCMGRNSLYDAYVSADIELSKKAAIKIRDTIAKRLKELKEEIN